MMSCKLQEEEKEEEEDEKKRRKEEEDTLRLLFPPIGVPFRCQLQIRWLPLRALWPSGEEEGGSRSQRSPQSPSSVLLVFFSSPFSHRKKSKQCSYSRGVRLSGNLWHLRLYLSLYVDVYVSVCPRVKACTSPCCTWKGKDEPWMDTRWTLETRFFFSHFTTCFLFESISDGKGC